MAWICVLSGRSRVRQEVPKVAAIWISIRGSNTWGAVQPDPGNSFDLASHEDSKSPDTRPTVVLFGWLGARTRYFEKYALATTAE